MNFSEKPEKTDATPDQVTALLVEATGGDKSAVDRLLPLIYDDLRGLAEGAMRSERRGHTLQPTALIHEAYLRLVNQTRVQWRDRAHFFAVAATVIRRVLVDHARGRGAAKRGGGRERVSLDQADPVAESPDVDMLALDEAMNRLAGFDARKSRVVESRFFGGLGIDDTAEVLGVSHATVERDWSLARAWLFRELDGGAAHGH